MPPTPHPLAVFLDRHDFQTACWGRAIWRTAYTGAPLVTLKDVDEVLRALTRGDLLQISERPGKIKSLHGLEALFRGSLALQGLWENKSLKVAYAEKYSSAIRDLRVMLETYTQHEIIDCALFITPPHAQTLAPHIDSEHTFTLQILGSKTWDFGARTPGQGTVKNPSPVAQSITLQAGDLLYVPGGYEHTVRANDTFSVSLGFGIQTLSARDVLQQALELWARQSFAYELPCDWNTAETKRAVLAEVQREVAASFTPQLLQAALDKLEINLLQQRVNPHLISLEDLFELDDEDTTTRYSRCLPLRWEQDTTSGQLTLYLTESLELSFAAEYLPALTFIKAAVAPFTPADLPGALELTQKTQFLAQLLTFGGVRKA